MPKRILIIDDEDDIRDVVALALETVAAWQVLGASSGLEGVSSATQTQPDAILLDVSMPNQDGIATFEQLRANPTTQSIPTILLTAQVQEIDRRRFADLNIAGVIAKPFDPLTLAMTIAEILQWDS